MYSLHVLECSQQFSWPNMCVRAHRLHLEHDVLSTIYAPVKHAYTEFMRNEHSDTVRSLFFVKYKLGYILTLLPMFWCVVVMLAMFCTRGKWSQTCKKPLKTAKNSDFVCWGGLYVANVSFCAPQVIGNRHRWSVPTFWVVRQFFHSSLQCVWAHERLEKREIVRV